MGTQITRKQGFRGMKVRVVLRDGRPDLVGTLDAWGTQSISVRPTDQTVDWPWKRHDVPVALAMVYREENEMEIVVDWMGEDAPIVENAMVQLAGTSSGNGWQSYTIRGTRETLAAWLTANGYEEPEVYA